MNMASQFYLYVCMEPLFERGCMKILNSSGHGWDHDRHGNMESWDAKTIKGITGANYAQTEPLRKGAITLNLIL